MNETAQLNILYLKEFMFLRIDRSHGRSLHLAGAQEKPADCSAGDDVSAKVGAEAMKHAAERITIDFIDITNFVLKCLM